MVKSDPCSHCGEYGYQDQTELGKPRPGPDKL